ncbi:MAG: ribosome assembly RNA-binding protein YhbY [Legionella sp.]|nr:MAG: ribosome assembly RNA-binding protein YhbY [Legionella sp.]
MDSTLKKSLKAQAHHLNPVILMGNKGLTEALIAETDLALTSHELIKIKLVSGEKAERLDMVQHLCETTQAALVQLIGHIAVVYRKNPEK